MRSLGGKIVRNALWNVIPFVWTLLLNLFIIQYVVKHIGISHYGLFGVFAVMLMPLGLANMGFAEATIKYVAERYYQGDLAEASKYVQTTLWMNSWIGLVGGSLLFIFGGPLVVLLFKVEPENHELVTRCMRLVGGGWFFSQIASVFSGIPAAVQNYRIVAAGQVLLSTITALLSYLLIKKGGGLYGYTLANFLGNVAGVIVWFGFSHRLLRGQWLGPRLDAKIWRQCFYFGGWQALGQLGSILANQSEKFLLGFYLNTTSLGYYNIAFNIETRIYAVVLRISAVLFPMFSALSHASLAEKANRLMRASWILGSVSVILLVPIIPLAEPILRIWINEEIAGQARLVLQLLAVVGSLGSATNAVYYFLLGNGYTAWIAINAFLTGMCIVIGSSLILPVYGLQGAVVSSLIAMILQQGVVRFYVLRKVFGSSLSSGYIFESLYGPMTIGLGLGLGFSFMDIQSSIQGWISLILTYIGLGTLCGTVNLLITILLPHGQENLNDLRRIVNWTVRKSPFTL